MTPRDYVRQPPPWAPLAQPGQATFVELLEVLDDHHDVALVGRDDREMGPYTACIIVPSTEVPRWQSKGFRGLTRREYEETWAKPERYVLATD